MDLLVNANTAYPPFHPATTQPLQLSMSREEFERAFPQESGVLEFKSGASPRPIQEAVVAFSNSDGGVILIGVNDRGEVLGRELTQNLEETIHHAVSETRHPGQYWVHRLEVDGKPVVAVSVAPRIEGFSQTSSGRVLTRRGPSNTPLFDSDLLRFVQQRSLDRFELQETDLRPDDAAEHLTEALADAFGWRDETALAERLREQNLVGPTGHLTVAGALYLSPDPSDVLGKTYVEVLRYPESDSPDYDRRVEIHGPLYDQVTDATAFVVDELGTELVVLGTQRYELPRLPPVVVREAIANAVAHRQYEDSRSAVRIELRPDVVRVISPGPLPTPVTVANIRDAQAPRNVAVIRVLRRFGVAEDAGRGVDVMQDSMRAELLEPPAFDDTGYSVEVTLPIRSTVTASERAWVRELERRGELEPVDRILLVHSARGEKLTNRRSREITGLDRVEATRALQRLRRAGFLTQHGTRGGATYQLDRGLAPPAGRRLSPDEQRAVVRELAREGAITNASVRERLGIDRVEALRILESLVDDGTLRRRGERRGTHYLLAGTEI